MTTGILRDGSNEPNAGTTVVALEMTREDADDMAAAARKVGLTIEEWILTLTEGPLRHFRQCREQDSKPKRRRLREND